MERLSDTKVYHFIVTTLNQQQPIGSTLLIFSFIILKSTNKFFMLVLLVEYIFWPPSMAYISIINYTVQNKICVEKWSWLYHEQT